MTRLYEPRRVMHVEALPWTVSQQQFTRGLLVMIATWTRVLSWQHVTTLFGCAGGRWSTPSKPW